MIAETLQKFISSEITPYRFVNNYQQFGRALLFPPSVGFMGELTASIYRIKKA
jgi:hypothetical protein